MSHMTWISYHIFEMEHILENYRYKCGDLMHYRQPGKNLDERLVLISSDMDVLQMLDEHIGHNVVEVYL